MEIQRNMVLPQKKFFAANPTKYFGLWTSGAKSFTMLSLRPVF